MPAATQSDNSKPVLRRFQSQRTVRFIDTDINGSMHTDAFVRLLEETEYDFLRSCGLSVVLTDEKGLMGFPRLSANVTMNRPLGFDETVNIELRLINVDGKMVEYEFSVTDSQCDQGDSGQQIGSGNFKVAVCRFPAGKPPYAILTPEFVIEALTSSTID